jgi:hypothetical protein
MRFSAAFRSKALRRVRRSAQGHLVVLCRQLVLAQMIEADGDVEQVIGVVRVRA